MGAALGFGQLKPCAAADDVDAVIDPSADELFDVHDAGHALVESKHVTAERELDVGELIKLVDGYVGNFIALEVENDAHPVLVRLIADVGDAGNRFFIDEVGDALR